MGDFKMPSLGADMAAGILIEWLVAPGDRVARGDLIAAVETSKGVIDIEVFEDGVVSELLLEPGAEVPVGTLLARIQPDSASEPAPVVSPTPTPTPSPTVSPAVKTKIEPATVVAPALKTVTEPAPQSPPAAISEHRVSATPTGRHLASPAARRRAAELGVDLATIAGSGPGGAIRLGDLPTAPVQSSQPALTSAAPAPAPATPAGASPTRRFDPDAMRRAIGNAMERSKREIPHYYLTSDCDLSTTLAWLEQLNTDEPPARRVLAAAVLIRAVARALAKYPRFNGFYRDGTFDPGAGVHIGMAISLRGGGLVTPALRDCCQGSLVDLMQSLSDLVKRARSGRLRGSELTDATLTVTSLGVSGVPVVLPIIFPPQVAIVGIGKQVDRPWAVDGRVEVRPIVTLSLGADHRVTDGHHGALFLRAIDKFLQNPESLL